MESTNRDPNQQLFITVDGITKIELENFKAIRMNHPCSLHYYNGFIKSGSQIEKTIASSATIFCFSSPETAQDFYSKLGKFDHPCVIEGLGYGNGHGYHSSYSFLAVMYFDTTFEPYTRKNGPSTDQNGRFTEEFMKLVSDVINGMEELHIHDYYCPLLKGDDIAIVKQDSSLGAKLWNFSKCTSAELEKRDKAKNGDWLRLGLMLRKVSSTLEITDLCDRIGTGELKGMAILKHSALLTVRKKFENVLALNQYISLHFKKGMQASMPNEDKKELEISELSLANLEKDLDKKLSWTLPQWIHAESLGRKPNTLRGFIYQMRTIIEHEVSFLSPDMTSEFSAKDILGGAKRMDLEHYFQKQCGDLYLTLQSFVAQLGLKY